MLELQLGIVLKCVFSSSIHELSSVNVGKLKGKHHNREEQLRRRIFAEFNMKINECFLIMQHIQTWPLIT